MILFFILILLSAYSMQAMEQLSPRSKEIVTDMRELFQAQCKAYKIGNQKQKTMLQVLLDTACLDDEETPTVDDWANFAVSKSPKAWVTDSEKIVGVAGKTVVEYSGRTITKFDIELGERKTLYEYEKGVQAYVEHLDYISDQLFAFQVFQDGRSCVCLHRNNITVSIKPTLEDSLRLASMCLNADGSVLVYIQESPVSNHLSFYHVDSQTYVLLDIGPLKEEGIKSQTASLGSDDFLPEKQTFFAVLARNPIKQNEIVCLSPHGVLFIIDCSLPRIVKQIRAFSGFGEQNILVSPNGRYILATNNKTLKIWDRESNFENPETYIMGRDIKAISFSPKGNYLAVVTKKCIEFLSLKTGKFIATEINDHPWESFTFMPDGLTGITKSGTVQYMWALQPLS